MASKTPLDNSKHLSLIDAGVSNIWSLTLPGHLVSLNLHGNYIRHISNLSHLSRLRHLDLSANQISSIDGLDSLVCLQTLNLSCNILTSVDGLSPLRCLERLNLSYNQIDNLEGLTIFSGTQFSLAYLALHGNKLRDVRHLTQCLSGVKSLKNLVLSQDGSSNPLCHNQGYESILWKQLPYLETINDIDKNGQLSKEVDSVTSIPGLEAYLDFLLLSKDKDKESEEKPTASSVPLITPKIDAVMEQFKQRCLQESSSSSLDRQAAKSSSPHSDNAAARTQNMHQILLGQDTSEVVSDYNSSNKPRKNEESFSSEDDSEPVKEPSTVQVKSRPGLQKKGSKVMQPQIKGGGPSDICVISHTWRSDDDMTTELDLKSAGTFLLYVQA
ncbi:leucine-rich repeat and coiled-coil domain-containing protein 1 [Plakobranchus ocellatus]|uniref:Leucine-rich repeat and coiled-coil domain-containing protein 1 n=1 Tax=Plakobranchus ocellatus TaxID=259542 RepID=A0AAV4BX60_9GAST|nr:leucine-rich repeat and coiled-coil domain-containing protein 1 [Plakobranchus ocellatus]